LIHLFWISYCFDANGEWVVELSQVPSVVIISPKAVMFPLVVVWKLVNATAEIVEAKGPSWVALLEVGFYLFIQVRSTRG
jgi:hypothetical protein